MIKPVLTSRPAAGLVAKFADARRITIHMPAAFCGGHSQSLAQFGRRLVECFHDITIALARREVKP